MNEQAGHGMKLINGALILLRIDSGGWFIGVLGAIRCVRMRTRRLRLFAADAHHHDDNNYQQHQRRRHNRDHDD